MVELILFDLDGTLTDSAPGITRCVQYALTYLFITHDLRIVHFLCDRVAVMYLGKVIEKAPAEELFANPIHPYTKALLSAIPTPDIAPKKERIILRGEISSPINLPDECRFSPRCNHVCEECTACDPALVEFTPGHFVACHFADRFSNAPRTCG